MTIVSYTIFVQTINTCLQRIKNLILNFTRSLISLVRQIFVVLFLHLPITSLMIRITLQEVVVEILLTCDGMVVNQVKMKTLLPADVCFMHPSRWPEIGRKDYIVKHVSIGIDVENIFLDIYLFEVTVNT